MLERHRDAFQFATQVDRFVVTNFSDAKVFVDQVSRPDCDAAEAGFAFKQLHTLRRRDFVLLVIRDFRSSRFAIESIHQSRTGDDGCQLKRDRGQRTDLDRTELARLDRLDRHHADQALAIVQWDAQERVINFFVRNRRCNGIADAPAVRQR